MLSACLHLLPTVNAVAFDAFRLSAFEALGIADTLRLRQRF